MITNKQRNTIYLLLRDLCMEIMGRDTQSDINELRSITDKSIMDLYGLEYLSLGNCSKETARNYIGYLLDLGFKIGIKFRFDPKQVLEDMEQYMYICTMNRVCCICGLPGADIHHITGSKVGMGRDRTNINHEGLEVLPLCRKHHEIIHVKEKTTIESYHLKPIPLNQELIKKLNI